MRSLYAQVEACAEAYGVPFFDYSRDARFAFDEALFKDSDHLNGQGARRFTGSVIDELERAGLIAPDGAA